MTRPDRPANQGLFLLLAATILCYLVGYPLALVGHSSVGWFFVFLGGPFLIMLGVVVIRRVNRASRVKTDPTDSEPS